MLKRLLFGVCLTCTLGYLLAAWLLIAAGLSGLQALAMAAFFWVCAYLHARKS